MSFLRKGFRFPTTFPRFVRGALAQARLPVARSVPSPASHPPPITADGHSLSIASLEPTHFPYQWLRDSCLCASCIHPSTQQKLHRTSDVQPNVAPAPSSESVLLTETGLHVEWDDGHKSTYDVSFLERHASSKNLASFHRDPLRVPWDNATIKSSPNLFTDHAEFVAPSGSGLLKVMTQLQQYGLVFLRGVPVEETSDALCAVRKTAERLSELIPTFYGTTWDVRNIKDSTNIAYTNRPLGLHMDLLYFENPPRYQILHCLRNRVNGGRSIFVDGAYAANRLRKSSPSSFRTLTETPVAFHYINAGQHYHAEHPTIQLGRFSNEVEYVNYSPPFQAPLAVDTPSQLYDALYNFATWTEKDSSKFEYTMQEGDLVIFDNRRTLHARTGFEDTEMVEDGKVNRWLKGCYFDNDAMAARARKLRKELEDGQRNGRDTA